MIAGAMIACDVTGMKKSVFVTKVHTVKSLI